MQDMRKNIFRKCGEIELSSGTKTRGVILPKSDSISYRGIRDELKEGELYVYMGDGDLKAGDTVTSGGERFIVLTSNRLEAFGRCFCSRAVLERLGGV